MALTIDLNDIINQIQESIPRIKAEFENSKIGLHNAQSAFINDSLNFDTFLTRIISSKTSFLVGIPLEKMTNAYSVVDYPSDYTVYATDGSQIDIDRNQSIPHYLLNISKIRLSYGDDYGADLNNECKFYLTHENMYISDDSHEQLLNSSLLSIVRGIEELRVLTELIESNKRTDTTVALADGTLILWTLANKDIDDWIVHKLLDEQYLHYMDRLKELHNKKCFTFGSYISFSGSNDVINALRVMACPFSCVDCDKNCSIDNKRPCDIFNGASDRLLFNSVLKEGERSVIFKSQSSILNRYREHAVYFFYIKIQDEISRIEIPKWIAEDTTSINTLHSVIIDQCKKGNGYPVVLSEAHESAVITYKETETIRNIMRNELLDSGITYETSAKSKSKIRREI